MHRNARLTLWGRQEIVHRHQRGWSLAEIARQLNISRPTASKWWNRYLADPQGPWFEDRSSRPRSCPHQTPGEVELLVLELRRGERLGPARIGYRLELSPSTVWKVLRRHQLNRLARMDRVTGRPVRRYEKDQPGELIHLDTKRIAAIPPGGGWWAFGEPHHNLYASRQAARGYQVVHAAVDDHSRLAYAEVLPDARADSCSAFWRRAQGFLAGLGIETRAVMTDNAKAYRSQAFRQALDGTPQLFIRPYRPQQNGKVERFNRTLRDEWAYARIYTSEEDRSAGLTDWLHTYNYHRGHRSIGGPPISRVNNQRGSYT